MSSARPPGPPLLPGVPQTVARALGRPELAARVSDGGTIRIDTLSEAREASSAENLANLPRVALGDHDGAELRVCGVLGQGGMGEVLLAEQRSLRREVAVKVLRLRDRHPNDVAALLREAVVTGRLEHPGIVPVHQLGVDADGQPLLVMKRVEGVSWAELIGQPEHPGWRASKGGAEDVVRRQLEIFVDVCAAIEYAHSRGVVHRDLKPSNVMVGPFGEVYVLDWGIATEPGTAAYAHGRQGDEVGLPLGTPGFMAPEMVCEGGVVDERTDVYQLGATLHAALTGQPRHVGPDAFAVLQSVMASEPVTYPRTVPAPLAELCNKATRAQPDERHGDVRQLRDEVATYLRHHGSIALAQRAQRSLDEMDAAEGEEDGARAREIYGQCRFAFAEALRQWPDNQVAREGLQRVLERSIERHLTGGELELAGSLLAELPEPVPLLAERLEALRAERARELRRLASLRELERDLDVSVGYRARLLFFLVLTVVGTASVLLYVPIGERPALVPLTAHTSLGMLAAVALAVLLGAQIFRRTRLDNSANRRIVALMLLTISAMAVNRFYGGLEAVAEHHIVAVDLLLCTFGTAVGALVVSWRMAVMAASFAAGSVAAMLWPSSYLAVFLFSTAVALSSGGAALRGRPVAEVAAADPPLRPRPATRGVNSGPGPAQD